MSFETATRVHFIGIGGAGMSAIAKVLLERKIPVSGSDLKGSRAMTVLAALGADVRVGHDGDNVEGADLVVMSAAIPESNPELERARRSGIKVLTRGEALAELLEGSRSVIVAGTHGKTTTTSMIVSIFRTAGLDPTFLVGGGLNDSGTNALSGSGDLSVAESDESDGSFLLLHPHVAVVTNIEMDHVDHWGSMDELTAAFQDFMDATHQEGALVVPAGGSIEEGARSTGRTVLTFGGEGDLVSTHARTVGRETLFTVATPAGTREVRLQALGEHNIANALAAIGAALTCGVELDLIVSGLGSFRGVERRFDLKGEVAGVTVIDDYAHHPTEVRATLKAAQSGPWDRVIAVFQPHRYSRTAALHREFGAAFADADRIIVTDIYGAGEEPVPGVSGKLVSDAVCSTVPGRGVAFLPHRSDVIAYLRTTARDGDLVLTLGAGDVTSLGEEFLQVLDAQS
ncbi:MAG: UDP-N-acetylmuramate--alanine ligase [Actinomycetota bacterium]|jgi:UDP-N-acetylmuramate--alanine ligase|nr:UDP-N-acetylmuramate--alanine ligase [Actinomycetota bacterium]